MAAYPSAEAVPPERWDEVAHGSVRGISHRWALFFERSLVNPPPTEYVVLDDEHGPFANLVITQPIRGNMPWLVHRLMGVSLTFLPPYSTGGGVALRETSRLSEDLRTLCGAILDLARTKRKHIVTVEGLRDPWLEVLAEEGFRYVKRDDTTEVDVPKTYADFLDGLRYKHRKEIRRLGRRAAEAGVTFSVSHEFAHRSEELFALVSRVFEAHRSKALPFSAELYPALARVFGEDARLFEARVADRLAATMMVIRDGTELKVMFSGFDYEVSRRYNLYLMLLDQIMKWAIEHGIAKINAGNTTYDLKAQIGYRKIPLWTGYRAVSPMANGVFGAIAAIAERRGHRAAAR